MKAPRPGRRLALEGLVCGEVGDALAEALDERARIARHVEEGAAVLGERPRSREAMRRSEEETPATTATAATNAAAAAAAGVGNILG